MSFTNCQTVHYTCNKNIFSNNKIPGNKKTVSKLKFQGQGEMSFKNCQATKETFIKSILSKPKRMRNEKKCCKLIFKCNPQLIKYFFK